MTLGKKIRDLFHLERAFEGNWEIELPPEKQKTVRISISASDFLDLIVQVEDHLDLFGQRFQRVDYACPLRRRKIPHATEEQPEKRENYKLRRKRFRRRHANL